MLININCKFKFGEVVIVKKRGEIRNAIVVGVYVTENGFTYNVKDVTNLIPIGDIPERDIEKSRIEKISDIFSID